MRIRITPFSYKNIDGIWLTSSEIVKAQVFNKSCWKKGTLDIKYLPKGKFEEMIRNRFAYTNQPKERIV